MYNMQQKNAETIHANSPTILFYPQVYAEPWTLFLRSAS